MIIKLVEQPIIAIHEAEIAGTVDGVVIKGTKISCIYHRNMENCFAIPVDNVIIGDDAVMVQDVTAMTLASHNVKPLKSLLDVYSISGRHLGCLQGIETDDDFVVRYMLTENYSIEMSRIVSYEDVIVADVEVYMLEKWDAAHTSQDAGRQEAAEKGDSAEEEAAISMEIGPEINWNDDYHQRQEKAWDNSELSVVRPMHASEGKADVSGVDPKYAYLCGKQLLEDIDIENAVYEKGTIIDSEMIKHAIGTNAIVKVIVNAEE